MDPCAGWRKHEYSNPHDPTRRFGVVLRRIHEMWAENHSATLHWKTRIFQRNLRQLVSSFDRRCPWGWGRVELPSSKLPSRTRIGYSWKIPDKCYVQVAYLLYLIEDNTVSLLHMILVENQLSNNWSLNIVSILHSQLSSIYWNKKSWTYFNQCEP